MFVRVGFSVYIHIHSYIYIYIYIYICLDYWATPSRRGLIRQFSIHRRVTKAVTFRSRFIENTSWNPSTNWLVSCCCPCSREGEEQIQRERESKRERERDRERDREKDLKKGGGGLCVGVGGWGLALFFLFYFVLGVLLDMFASCFSFLFFLHSLCSYSTSRHSLWSFFSERVAVSLFLSVHRWQNWNRN